MKKKIPEVKRDSKTPLKDHELKKKVEEIWKTLDQSEKMALEAEAEAERKAYAEAMDAFKASENWKKYEKMVAPAKGGGGGPLPPKPPPGLPTKPADCFKAFCQENPKASAVEANKLFKELPAEDKEERQKAADERMAEYTKAKAAFDASPAGKKYFRALAAFKKKKVLDFAKAHFLKDAPKKPPGAYFIFTNETRPHLATTHPGFAAVGKMGEMWAALTPEQREVWNIKAKEADEEYQKKQAEFEKTAKFKKYQSALRRANASGGMAKANARPKAKAVPMGPPAPENLSKKPKKSGSAVFMGEQTGPRDMKRKMWENLGEEKRKEYNEAAEAKKTEYEEAMEDFAKTAEGKKYLRLKAAAYKKKKPWW